MKKHVRLDVASGKLSHNYGNWPIEIVDLPMKKMVILQFAMGQFTRG